MRRWWLLAVAVAVTVSVGVVVLASGGNVEPPGATRRSPSPGTAASPAPGEYGPMRLAGPKRLRYCYRDTGNVPAPSPSASHRADYDAQFAFIANRVERLRNLFFTDDAIPAWVNGDEMQDQLAVEARHVYTESDATQQEIALRMLGALRGPIDLSRTARVNPLGFYSPTSGQVFVLRDPSGEIMTSAEMVTVAHELTHAITDQQFELPQPETVVLADRDRNLAWSSLSEGDASLVENRFSRSSLTPDELAEYKIDPGPPVGKTPGTTRATRSYFLVAEGQFPYTFGMSFACALYNRDGWKAVNAAYKDPPQSSAQILYPDRYVAREEPSDPDDPRTPRGWSELPVQSLGAADLMWLFEAPGTRLSRSLTDPYARAAAWGGGELHLYRRGNAHAMSLDLVEHPEFEGLCLSIAAWYRVSFPVTAEHDTAPHERFAIRNRWGAAVLRCEDNEVRLGVGPTLPLARALSR